MDKNSVFSALSLFSVLIYMYIGINTFRQDKKSIINKVFLLLCLSYSIWSFAYAFAYVAVNSYVFSIWNKISAFGWCSFSALSLYLVLLITENRAAKNKIIVFLIFLPFVVFLYMALFLFGEGINTPKIISDVFYIGDFLYNFTFLLMSIIIMFLWGRKTSSKRIKMQSKILVVSSSLPFLLNLLTQNILPSVGYTRVPLMGQLYAVIMIIGIYIVITRYKFLKTPERIIVEEVENKIIDMVIVMNEKGKMIKISKNTINMLGFEEDEIINKDFMVLFHDIYKEKLSLENIMQGELNYKDIEIMKKCGDKIPVDVTAIPIWDSKIHDFLGAAVVMQDITIEHELRRKNEELHEKTIRDGLTNLYNHQYSVELIKKEIEEVNKSNNKEKFSLMMLDIDYFKKVNDVYGHLYGDYVLEVVSDILLTSIGDSGYVGRFGGEEFIVILPKIRMDKAYALGEKIRSEIENYKFHKGLNLTISIGIKEFNNEAYTELVKNTDDLLYKSKENGRNRIEYL